MRHCPSGRRNFAQATCRTAGATAEDHRHWLTKETELAYYNLCANKKYRLDYFLDKDLAKNGREYHLARVLKKNPLFLAESYFTKQLENRAEHILWQYAVGRLIVAGDNRFSPMICWNFWFLCFQTTSGETIDSEPFTPVPFWINSKSLYFTRPKPPVLTAIPAPCSAIPTSPATRKCR